jgi:polyisoprenoid-binding protein YceI
MNNKNFLIAGAVAVVVVLGGIAYAFRPLTAPTQPASPIPVADDQVPAEQMQTKPEDMNGASVFRIVSEKSVVEFNLHEVLRGEDFLVIGSSTQVTGDIALNTQNPSASTVGKISVNARTIQTDAENRDRMIGRFILESEKPEYEFITFTPTKIEGMPGTIKVGDAFAVTITGDLKIRDIVKSVTFTGTVALDAEDRLTGSFEGKIQRGDYQLVIPDVPFVASVQEEVTLKIRFDAKKI